MDPTQPVTKSEPTRVHELVDRLRGTCDSVDDEQDGWTPEELEDFDDLIFCCASCGWWYDTGEAHDAEDTDLICEKCGEE